jgi:hypothetical protein
MTRLRRGYDMPETEPQAFAGVIRFRPGDSAPVQDSLARGASNGKDAGSAEQGGANDQNVEQG